MNDSAEELLRAADGGSERGRAIAQSADHRGRIFAIVLGLLLAGFLLGIELIVPARVPWQLIAVTVFYAVGVLAVTLWFVRNRTAAGLGWRKRYSRAFTLSIVLYAVGIAIGTSGELSSPIFWFAYAAVTATPLVVAGLISSSAP